MFDNYKKIFKIDLVYLSFTVCHTYVFSFLTVLYKLCLKISD